MPRGSCSFGVPRRVLALIGLTLVALVAMMSASAAATASTPRGSVPGIGPRVIGASRCHRARRHRRAVLDRCLRSRRPPNLWALLPGTAPVARCRSVRLHPAPARSTAGWALSAGGRARQPRSARRGAPKPCATLPEPTRRRGPLPAWTGPCPCPAGRTGRPPRRQTSTLHWAPWGRRRPLASSASWPSARAGVCRRAGQDRRQLGALRPRGPGAISAPARSASSTSEHCATTWLPGSRHLISRGPLRCRRSTSTSAWSRPLPPMARTSSSAVWRTPACRRDFAWLSPRPPLRPGELQSTSTRQAGRSRRRTSPSPAVPRAGWPCRTASGLPR